MRKIAYFVICELMLILLPTETQQIVNTDWTISIRQAGKIRFGCSLEEVRKIIGDPKATLYISNPDDPLGEDGCTYLESYRLPKGLSLMFNKRQVVRVDVFNRSVAHTIEGARVGDTEERIKYLYKGQIKIEPHQYDPENGHYLIYVPGKESDREFNVLFETDGKKVIQFRAGFSSATSLVEGCS
jgi:hypothetical protein